MPKFFSDGHFSGSSTDLTIDGNINVGSYYALDGSAVVTSDRHFYGKTFNDTDDTNYYLDPANTGMSLSVAGDVTVEGGQVFLTANNYAIENVSGNYGIRNSNGNYGGNDGTNAYTTPQDFFHIPGTVRIGPKYSTSDRDHIRIVPAGTTSTIEMPNENAYIHNNQGNIVLRTGSSTDAVTVTGANTTFVGDIYGKSVNNAYSLLYRFGGLFFTWDSDSYGTNTHHSIRSTYGDSFQDSITLNSYNHIRFNIDSNNNNATSYFEVGDGTTSTGNIRFRVNNAGRVYAKDGYYDLDDTAYFIKPADSTAIQVKGRILSYNPAGGNLGLRTTYAKLYGINSEDNHITALTNEGWTDGGTTNRAVTALVLGNTDWSTSGSKDMLALTRVNQAAYTPSSGQGSFQKVFNVRGNGDLYLGYNNSTGAVYATKYYDKASTSYYLDPGNSSTSLNVAGAATFGGEILNAMAAPKIRLQPTTQNNASILELGVLNGGTNAYARIDAINLNNYDSNLRFYTNPAGSTTQTLALTLNSDQSATFAGAITWSGGGSANANTAYGWGNHASAGYLTSFTETNGFLGDGGNASTHPGTSRLIYSGQVSAGSGVLGMPTSNNANAFINLNKHAGEYNSQLGFSSDGNIYYRNFNNAAINNSTAFRKIWDSGNDGSGSGLDADLLDGSHASSFWTKSGTWYGDLGSHSYTREIGLAMTGGSEFVVLSKSGQGSVLVDGHYMAYESANGFFGSFNSTYGNLTGIRASAANTLKVMQLDGGNAILLVTQDVRAPLYYDSDDTAYYVNPAGDSQMNQIHLSDYVRHLGDLDTYFGFNGADQWKLHLGGGDRLVATTSQFTSNLNVAAPLYYDKDDTSYYLNPNGTNVSLNVAGSGSFGGSISSSNINTSIKYLGVGVSYDTDRTTKVTSGVALYGAYNGGSNSPHTYDFSAQFIGNARGFELSAAWHSQTRLKIRSLRDCCQNWSSFYDIAIHGLNNQAGDLYASKYYDESNTGYYLDPASTSKTSINIIDGRLTIGQSGDAGSTYRLYSAAGGQVYLGGHMTATSATFSGTIDNGSQFANLGNINLVGIGNSPVDSGTGGGTGSGSGKLLGLNQVNGSGRASATLGVNEQGIVMEFEKIFTFKVSGSGWINRSSNAYKLIQAPGADKMLIIDEFMVYIDYETRTGIGSSGIAYHSDSTAYSIGFFENETGQQNMTGANFVVGGSYFTLGIMPRDFMAASTSDRGFYQDVPKTKSRVLPNRSLFWKTMRNCTSTGNAPGGAHYIKIKYRILDISEEFNNAGVNHIIDSSSYHGRYAHTANLDKSYNDAGQAVQ